MPDSLLIVGRLVGLWRYPVKSMAGEALDAAEVGWNGVAGDRRWAFVRAGVERSGFPWLTIRQKPDLLAYRPRLVAPERPDASPVQIETPTGATVDVLDPALADELGHGARPIKQDRGVFDAFPISLITTQTARGLSDLTGRPVAVERFRPNLVVEASGEAPFPEDAWVGATLQIGTLAFRVDKRDGRCVVITVDSETRESDPAILRAVAQERDGCAGVYGSVVTPGRVAVGDAVALVR
ncbi:MAG: MOSC N-terminal beta barrel domain-containing protein [Bacteroidota bacterium]